MEAIEAEQRRRAYKRNRPRSDTLAGFIREGWHVLEPATPYVHNWHIDAIAEHLEAVTAGQIQKLLINIPPGCMKSLSCSVFWPAWEWGPAGHPEYSGLFSSYGDDLVLRDAQKCRDLVESEWYQTSFEPSWRFHPNQNAKSFFRNTAGGFRFSHTVGGGGTGHRGFRIVVDDSMKATDAYSEPARKDVIRWWRETMHNRLSDAQRGAKVVMGQRLHEEDLPGWILANDTGWVHLRLPMEHVVALHCRTPWFDDPRTREKELLFPERFPPAIVEADRRILGSSGFAAQNQQTPMPAEGGMFKKHWWRFWRRPSEPDVPGFESRTVILPTHFDEQLLSADCAFKKTDDGSKVCIGAWARVGSKKFLFPAEWDFMTFTETCAALLRLVIAHPGAHAKLIEAKANGPAVIDALKSRVSGLIPVEPEGGKESRAAATAPQVEAGDVYLPLHWDKRDEYIDEHASFPKGTRNDAVDMQSQALTRWIKKPMEYGGQPKDLPQRRV